MKKSMCVACAATLVVALLPHAAPAQTPTPGIFRTHTYGGDQNDGFSTAGSTSDGGTILAGNTRSFGAIGWDGYVVRTDADNEVVWERHFGSLKDDRLTVVFQTASGDFFAAGSANYDPLVIGTQVSWLFRINPNGSLGDETTFGWVGSDTAIQHAFESRFGGFLVTGYTYAIRNNRDIFVWKFDDNLNPVWDEPTIIERRNNDFVGGLIENVDGDIVVAGTGYDNNNPELTEADPYLVRLSQNGQIIPGSFNFFAQPKHQAINRLIQTRDDGYLLVGFETDSDFYTFPYMFRVGADGSEFWTKTFVRWFDEIPLQREGALFDAIETDEGFVLAGQISARDTDFGGRTIAAEIRLTPDSSDLTSTWIVTNDHSTDAHKMLLDSHGNYILAGGRFRDNEDAQGLVFMVGTEPPPPPPGQPQDLSVVDRGSSIGLSWIAPVSGSPIVGYHVFRAMQSMTPVRITESAVTETSYQDAPDESGRYCYTVISVAEDGQMSIPSLERCVDFSAAPTDDLFLRGDSNNDRELDLSDAIFTLSYLFVSGSPVTCQDAADANDDGSLDLSDPVYTLSFLFLRGQAPKTPYPDTGSDPTPDELGCHAYGE